ncbi:MAG TPA: PEP-CTERM sorting domain-containing protein [Verrucomicrobiae bacterium]|nr:PEP-CTERM sorting domain-containing protein [Verrucomicrobiae bacterium]
MRLPQFFIALMLALSVSIVRADIVADFPFRPDTGGGIAGFTQGPFQPAQTFYSLGSGQLQSVSIALAQNGPQLPNHIFVDFRLTQAGIPSSILGTATIDGGLVAGVQPGAPVMLAADFTSLNIQITAGETYAFSLRTDGNAAFASGSGAYIAYPYPGGSLFSSHDFGTTWSAEPLYDLNFQVTAVPEPSALALLLAGISLLRFIRVPK